MGASLPEGKNRGQCLVQLCAKYRLVSATIKEAASLKVKGPLYSCLLIARVCPTEVGRLIDIWKPFIPFVSEISEPYVYRTEGLRTSMVNNSCGSIIHDPDKCIHA